LKQVNFGKIDKVELDVDKIILEKKDMEINRLNYPTIYENAAQGTDFNEFDLCR